MTRKHFKKVAEILKNVKDAEERKEPVCALWLSQVFASLMAELNPRFDGYRFSKAIGFNYDITR